MTQYATRATTIWSIISDQTLSDTERREPLATVKFRARAGRLYTLDDESKSGDGKPLRRPSLWMVCLAIVSALADQLSGLGAEQRVLEAVREQAAKRGKKSRTGQLAVSRALIAFFDKSPGKSDTHKYPSIAKDMDRFVEPLLAELNEVRQARGMPALTEDEVFNAPDLVGPEAIDKLLKVIGLATPRVGFERIPECDQESMLEPARNSIPKPVRNSVTNEPLEFMIADDGVEDPRRTRANEIHHLVFGTAGGVQLINPFQSGMWRGLTALASGMFDPKMRVKTHQCPWPVLYLALQSGDDGADDAYIGIVQRIWTFYLNHWFYRHGQQSHDDDPRSAEDIEAGTLAPIALEFDGVIRAIRSTRALMTEVPGVIIFDGFQVPVTTNADETGFSSKDSPDALLGAIADDHVLRLIERLLMPPTSAEDDPTDLALFKENRFVLLSDRPIFEVSDTPGTTPTGLKRHRRLLEHPALRSVSGRSIEVPFPHQSKAGKLADKIASELLGVKPDFSEGRKQEIEDRAAPVAIIKAFYKVLPREFHPSEKLFGLFSALYRCEVDQQTIYEKTQRIVDDNVLIQKLSELLVDQIERTRPVSWQVFLEFLALAPSGIRPPTLCQLYRSFMDLPTTPEATEGFVDTLAEIRTMVTELGGIIGRYRMDHLGGFHAGYEPKADLIGSHSFQERMRWIMVHRSPIDTTVDEDQRMLQFRFPELRRAIIERFSRNKKGRHGLGKGKRRRVHYHFLLAEEAMAQHMLVALHANLQRDSSLRPRRRLLEALFHGLASVHDSRLDEPEIETDQRTILPTDTKKRWIWLYSEGYRRFLDRPPEHPLGRNFAADDVKLELLRLFRNPSLAWGNPPPSNRHAILSEPRKKTRKTGANRMPVPQAVKPGLDSLKSIRREFHANIQGAANAVGDFLPEAGVQRTRDANVDEVGARLFKKMLDSDLNRTSAVAHQFTQPGGQSGGPEAGLREIRDNDVKRLFECREIVEPFFPDGQVSDALIPFALFQVQLTEAKQEVRALLGARNFVGEPAGAQDHAFQDKVSIKASHKHLVDAINKYAEFTARMADFIDAEEKSRSTQVRKPTSDQVLDLYVEAFAAFQVADLHRNHLHTKDPLGAGHLLGGHMTRTWIRVGLKLERIAETRFVEALRKENPSAKTDDIRAQITVPGWFWLKANALKNHATLHVAQYPRERPGLLVIESTMARYYCSRFSSDRYSEYVAMALQRLKRVEPLILSVGMNTRLRRRFLLERCKVYRELGRTALPARADRDTSQEPSASGEHAKAAKPRSPTPEEIATAKKWIALARDDAHTLGMIASEPEDHYWIIAAQNQIAMLEQILVND